MKKKNSSKLVCNQKGVTIVLFGVIVVALFAFIAMAIDGANLFLAWTKMQNFSDAANLTALNVRIERGPQMRNPEGSADVYDCDFLNPGAVSPATPSIDEACVRRNIFPVAANLLKRNLELIGIDTDDAPPANSNPYKVTSVEKVATVPVMTAQINYIDCRPGGTSCYNPETKVALTAAELTDVNEFEYFTTQITYDVPLMLMHLVPFQMLGVSGTAMGKTVRLETTSQVILPALNVAVLADISGSMNDFAGNGTTRKIDDLVPALRTFVESFRPDRDKVSLWPFNLQTSRANSVPVTAAINQGFNLTAMRTQIDSLDDPGVASGNTNPVDAMLAAYHDFNTNGGDGSTPAMNGIIGNLQSGTKGEYTMVLFSDGAPTAMTAKFNNYPTANNNTVYSTMFEIAYRNSSTKLEDDIDNPDYIVGSEIKRAGPDDEEDDDDDEEDEDDDDDDPPWGMPSNFYQTSIVFDGSTSDSYLFGRLFGKTNYSVPGANGTTGTALMSSKALVEDPTKINTAWPVEGGTMVNLGFRMPNGQLVAGDAPIMNETFTESSQLYPVGFKRQFYNNLVATSDFIRSQLGYVYTVGLGQGAPGATAEEPYQDVRDSTLRKDNLLARVAADPDVVPVREFGFTRPDMPSCSYPGYGNGAPPGCNGWRNNRRAGHYIPTDNSADLTRIFQRISRQLQTKVVINPKSRTQGMPTD